MGDAVAGYLERYRSLALDGSPCFAVEVEAVERDMGVKLPSAYKAYLRTAGREPPAAWVGSDCTIVDLPKLRGWAEGLLRECSQPALPERAFVFLMHQGYQFFYIVADGSADDPPLFYYLESEPAVVRKFERFSDLVAVVAEDGRKILPP